MSKKIKTAMPPDLDLDGAYIIEWDAVDPTTGASVSGVKISDTSLGVEGSEAALADIGNPLLVGAGVIV
jgi:hypothetical protein